MKEKLLSFVRLTAALVLLCIEPTARASITQTFTFDKSKMSLTEATVNGETYSVINMDGLDDTFTDEGMPCIPYTHENISVPYNATNITVTATCDDVSYVTVPHKVLFGPREHTLNDSIPFEHIAPDSAVYNTSKLYPTHRATYLGHDYLFGINNIVTIALYPIRYNSVLDRLSLCSEIEVTIDYDIADVTSDYMPMRPIAIGDSLSARQLAQVADIVTNAAAVSNHAMPLETNYEGKQVNSVVGALPRSYQYTIITTEALKPVFARLVAWRQTFGYSAGVVTIEEIMNSTSPFLKYDTMYTSDSTLVEVTDSASRLRGYLRARLRGYGTPKYVLIALDNVYRKHHSIPTDIYFSDLTTTWNIESNGTYAFPYTSSLLPEVFVGRLLCDCAEDIENYTDKVIRYEWNPGNGDTSYLKRGVYTECDWMQQLFRWGSERTVNMLNPIIDDYKLFSEYDFTTPTGTQVVNDIDSVHYGVWALSGHGSPREISVNYLPQYINKPIYSIVGKINQPTYSKKETGNGLDCMINSRFYPSIAYSIACTTMPFDGYKTPAGCVNWGKSFTCGKDYGGVAFLGNTRDSGIGGIYLQRAFFEEIISGKTIIGEANGYAHSVAFNGKYPNVDLGTTAMHNLLGDPFVNMWTNIPDTIVYEPPLNILYGNDKIILFNLCQGDVLCYCEDGGKKVIENHGYEVMDNHGVPLVVRRPHTLPYFIPFHMQNITFDTPHHVFASNIVMGNSVDVERTHGDVVFQSDYTIEANAEIELHDGVVIEEGGILDISTPSTVTVSGGIVKSGGTLKICAGKTEIPTGFIAEKGAKVEILPWNGKY